MTRSPPVTRPGERWCVLRCSPAKTLELAASLNDAGFEAWTPVDGDREPMTPSYVFARVNRLPELLALWRSPALVYRVWDSDQRRMVTKGHPYFSVMASLDRAGEWATVKDASLNPIRTIEWRRKPRGTVQAVPVGAKVRCAESGFTGLDGVVDSVRGKKATVLFEGLIFPVQLGCWQLTVVVDDDPKVNVNGFRHERAAKAA